MTMMTMKNFKISRLSKETIALGAYTELAGNFFAVRWGKES